MRSSGVFDFHYQTIVEVTRTSLKFCNTFHMPNIIGVKLRKSKSGHIKIPVKGQALLFGAIKADSPIISLGIRAVVKSPIQSPEQQRSGFTLVRNSKAWTDRPTEHALLHSMK